MTNEELLQAIRLIYLEQQENIQTNYNRSLSFADTILDNRWTRASRLGFSEGSSIYDSALVLGNVKVGKHSWVGPFAILDGSGGGLEIGEYCSISAGVHLYSHDTVLWALSGGALQRRESSIEIGDYCHIGAQSTVLPGVKIGRKCVIGANSVVNKNVPDCTVVVGSPAKVIGYVEGDGEKVRIRINK